MPLRLNIRVQGDPMRIMLDEILAAEKAVSKGTAAAGRGLLRDWRSEVRGALSYRLAGALRQRNYPEAQNSINAASLVYAPSARGRYYKGDRGASAAEVIDAHAKGVTIRSDRGLWLAIPVGKAAGMRGTDPNLTGNRINMRITPGGWERKTGRRLKFIYRKGKPSLLVDDGSVAPGNVMLWRSGKRGGYKSPRPIKKRRAEPVVVFILVPQVRLRRRMDLERGANQWGAALPGLILKHWK